MVQLEVREQLLDILRKDGLILQMTNGNTDNLDKYIDLLLNNTYEIKICKLYTMSRQLIYLISTFGSLEDSTERLKESIAISNYLALCDKDKVEQGASLSYENNFIKNYLMYSNTILNIADRVYTFGSIVPECYEQHRVEMLILQSDIYKSVFDDKSTLLDKEFWIETLDFVKGQVDKEILYLDGESDTPSERMEANQGISRAQYHGIQAKLDYNQSYKIE